MPPQTRRVKTLKENISVPVKTKVKNNGKVNRKPLADKTNSASDDNTSNLSSIKIIKKDVQKSPEHTIISKDRSRRTRRLPTRYEHNNVLKNLSNFSLSPCKADSQSTPKVTSIVNSSLSLSPHKTPIRISNSPLATKRSKRLCRLPSKFDGQSLSPTNNPSIQPSNASTPILNKVKKPIKQNLLPNIKLQDKHLNNKATRNNKKKNEKVLTKRTPIKTTPSVVNETLLNNSKQLDKRDTLKKETEKKSKTCLKKTTSKTEIPDKTISKSDTRKNVSIRLLDDKKKSLKRVSNKLDVYEFTFDPNEEPPPKKNKKKKTVKNPSKPKRVVKSSYERNLEKALAALKNTVSSKNKIQLTIPEERTVNVDPMMKNNSNLSAMKPLNPNVTEASENRYNSIRVEDIAMQFQDDNDDYNIDYSPINSPHNALPSPEQSQLTSEHLAEPVLSSTMHSNGNRESSQRPVNKKDPLNLGGDLSFFDEPIASSSMNVSVRHPSASPWRVEFNNLPIKWQVNSYVKSNMTPAIERSFINYNDKQKKHVYTNLVPDGNESLPQIVDNAQSTPTTTLKQTSIMTFIKEVVEKNANKKKKHMIIKSNSLFDDNTHSESISSRKNAIIPENIVERSNTSGEDMQSEKENSHQDKSETSAESKNTENVIEKEGDKDITYFGFDDSENQENVSPVKKKNKKKTFKTRTRKVLQAVNVDDPKNMLMPAAAISKPVRIQNQVNKLFVDAKTATEPPLFPEQNNNKNIEKPNVSIELTQTNFENDDDDCNSVHLFEDIELVHHLKPTRKSYGKHKKVTFQQSTVVNNQDSDVDNQGSSDVDDLDDLSFKLPSMKEKKITKKKPKKQQRSKKEEKEVEEWAAGFNSMCEDIEEFDLVVE